MPGLWIMLPIAIMLALAFLAFFFWSIRNGDFEDSEMEKYRILLDNEYDVDRTVEASGQSKKKK